MIWDVKTDSEFQKKLDWINEVLHEEVKPCEGGDLGRTNLWMIEGEVAAQ